MEFGGGVSAAGRPRLPVRLMVSLLYLKNSFNLSDEEYALYRQIYEHLQLQTTTPDLVIYLQTPVDALLKRIEQEAGALTTNLDPASVALERIRLAPRKSDIAVGRIVLAWEPWRAGPDGFPRPASTL